MVEISPAILAARKTNSEVYQTLEEGSKTIRLLRASRSLTDRLTGKVTWNLEDYRLGSSPLRRYTALSYYWGSGELTKSVIMNGRKFRVSDSVFPILEAIRTNQDFSSSVDGSSWWWIDFICINQSDVNERTSQVQMIGEIYKCATRTIGWLGKGSGGDQREDSEFSRRGEKAIESLRLLRKRRDSIVEGRDRDRKNAMQRIDPLIDWTLLEELLSRPWWTRVWTLQEYLLSNKFEFWCGKTFISRGDLKVAVYALYNMRHEPEFSTRISKKIWLPIWNRRRLLMWYWEEGEHLPLIALIAYGSESNATDPKDRIYSVLDLARRPHDENLVHPDYRDTFSIADVYSDLVKAFVERHGSLDIICFAQIFNQKHATIEDRDRLPSWVPDWRAKVPSFVMPVMASQSNNSCIGNFRPIRDKNVVNELKAYAASGDRAPEWGISQDGKMFQCKGVVLDTIKANEDRRQGIGLDVTPEEASAILDDLARMLVLGREDKYLGIPYSTGYYYHDFRAYCIAMEENHGGVPDAFREWFAAHGDLDLGGYTLKEICRLSLKKPVIASLYRSIDVRSENVFFSRFLGTTATESGMGKVLVTTEKGRLGMAPNLQKPGDKICVLLGCSIPLILRPKLGVYEVIGECYMNGFMNGEAVEMTDTKELAYLTFSLV